MADQYFSTAGKRTSVRFDNVKLFEKDIDSGKKCNWIRASAFYAT
jgi:hypothetical protein